MTTDTAAAIDAEPIHIVTANPETTNPAAANPPTPEDPASVQPPPEPEPEESRLRTLASKIRGRSGHPLDPTTHKDEAAESVGPSTSHPAHKLVDKMTGLPAVTPDKRERMEGAQPPETINISKEIVDGLRGFTESYVSKLIRMRNTPITIGGVRTTAYDEMKRQESAAGLIYSEDNYMLDTFATKDPRTGEFRIKNVEEINELIAGDPELEEILMEQVEKWTEDSLAAAGLRAEIRDFGNRTDLQALAREIDLGIGQGPLNKKQRETMRWLTEPVNQGERGEKGLPRWKVALGTIGVGALTGAQVGSPAGSVGILIGGVAGGALGPALASRIQEQVASGVRISLTASAQPTDPAESMRANYLFNIDPNNPLNSPGVTESMNEAIRLMYLRMEYMRSLGEHPNKLDASSSQFIYGNQQSVEETNSGMKNEVRLAFQRLGGWNPGQTPEQRRDIYRKARTEIMVNTFERRLARTEAEASIQPDYGQRLRDAIEARQDEGSELTRRTKDATEEKDRLGRDIHSLLQLSENIQSYKGKIEGAEEVRRKASETLSNITRAGVSFADNQNAIRALQETIGATGIAVTMVPDENGNLVPIPPLFDRAAAVDSQIATAIGNIAGKRPGESNEGYNERVRLEREAIKERFKPQKEQIASQRKVVEAAIRRLREEPTGAANAGKDALNSPTSTEAMRSLTEINSAHARLSGYGDPALNTAINSGDYTTALARINALYATNPALGWPDGENNLPENRLLIREAMVQARATSEMNNPANIPNHIGLETSFDGVVNNPVLAQRITEAQLRAMSIAELTARANTLGATTIIPELARAKEWANLQLEYTQRAITEENRRIQLAETAQDRSIRNVDLAGEREQLEMALNVYERSGDQINSASNRTFTGRESRANLENSSAAAAGVDGYTASEAASGLPRNILEIVNILTDYQNSPDRNGSFEVIWKNIGSNPDLLFRLISTAYSEKIPAGAANINILSTQIGGRVGLGITAPEFRMLNENLARTFVRNWNL